MVSFTKQEMEALTELLEQVHIVQTEAFKTWKIGKEPCPLICDSMQDVSYFLTKLGKTPKAAPIRVQELIAEFIDEYNIEPTHLLINRPMFDLLQAEVAQQLCYPTKSNETSYFGLKIVIVDQTLFGMKVARC